MKILRTALFSALLLAATAALAQKRWTLEECVAYALENNISVKQSELNLDAAEIDKRDAVGNFIPSLNGNIQNQWNIGLTTDVLTGVLLNQTTMNTSLGANVSVNLFNGLRNLNQLRQANLAILANQYQLADMKDDISLSVVQAYLTILFNREALKVLQFQNTQTLKEIERTKELVDNGVVPQGDLFEIQATAANQEQQIVDSENALRLSKISLAQLLLITDYENFDISDRDYDVPISMVLQNSPKTIYEKSLGVVKDVLISETNVDLAEYDLRISKGRSWPTLSANYGYATRASDRNTIVLDDDGKVIGIEGPAPLFDQFSMNDGHGFGLSLQIPIFNGFSTSNSIRRNKVNLERAKYDLEQTKIDLETTVNQSYNDAIGAAKAYEAAQRTLEARQAAFEYAQERFNVGLINSFDYSQAQQRKETAESDVIRTKYSYIFRLKILEFYFGIPITQI